MNKPTLVSIMPNNSYVDGCTPVTIQGHHLGTTATATIGGAEVTDLAAAEENPDLPDYAQDVGFKYTGVAPPAAGGPGFYDVVLTVDGEDLTIPQGFYYRACPASFVIDGWSIPGADPYYTSTVAPGGQIDFYGCGLSGDVTMQFVVYYGGGGTGITGGTGTIPTTGGTGTIPTPTGDTGGTVITPTGDTGGGGTTGGTGGGGTTGGTGGGGTTGGTGATPRVATAPPATTGTVVFAEAPLVSDCSTATAHVTVPSGLAPGLYEVWAVHSDGTRFSSVECTADGPYDTGVGACRTPVISVGGAR